MTVLARAPLWLARLPDWRTRLIAYLVQSSRQPLVYGQHDCALFWAGAVAAMTGHDLAAGWTGRYKTRAAGLQLLRTAGYDDQVAMAAALFAEVSPAFLQVGDLATVAGADGPACGVVQGEGIYVLTETGQALVPLSRAVRGFRV